MNGRQFDIAVVGGGLAGGLIAAALARGRPEVSLVVIEAQQVLGGNHRWSWFDSDLSPEGKALLQPFRKVEWDDGYDVAFPGHARTLSSHYRSLASAEFDAGLRRILPDGAIRTGREVVTIDQGGAILDNGERIGARTVIDCRGQAKSAHLTGGWQVFLGRHMRTNAPHGVDRPVIMDATIGQVGIVDPGAYRFVYVLPLSSHELFIEDTYYADSPLLDRSLLSGRIDAYCTRHGWEGDLLGSETGVLPVITGGDFAAFQAEGRVEGVARAGALAGFTHPLTSYTMPFAVETALAVARDADLPAEQMAAMLEASARQHWRDTGFYRLLGRMLFGAADPAQRWRIFERFYRLPQDLIERFYAGRSTQLDKARILIGKPPVPLARALGALLQKGTPMNGQEAV
ncbi:MAG TPA: lycopene beta-cyclase CrtY [Sphingomonadaceae bacterium]|nr:lycopene beta-cyclase CrtY [Sphingomonadaceae bacterium]